MSSLLTLALALPAWAQQAAFRPGESVEVLRYGQWVPGRTVRQDAGGVLVMLPLADGSYDESKCFRSYYQPAEVRRPAPPTPAPPVRADGDPLQPGREVEIKYGANWLRGKVERVEGDRVFVSWDGYDKSQNSWVARNDVRPRPDPLAPATGGPVQPADFYQPGREVEIKYGADWLRGKIEQVEADRVFVSWDGYDKSQNVWVPKTNVRPRGGAGTPAGTPAAPIVPPGKGELNGVQLWAQVTAQGTRIIRYLFRPDGTFVTGHAFSGGENLDFAEAVKKFPGSAGTYRVAGAVLTLDYADGHQLTKELVASDKGPRIKGWQLGIPFPAGHRLDATYEVQGGLAIAGATGDQSQRWTFRADGTFAVVEGRAADAGQGAAHAHTAEQLKWTGTYELQRHTLSFAFGGGSRRDYTIFLSGEEPSAAPRMMFVDQGVFKKQE